jgi:uncharacterized protein (DUF302 family)
VRDEAAAPRGVSRFVACYMRRMADPKVPDDSVDDALGQTFPASDPPGWTGMRAGPPASPNETGASATLKTLALGVTVDEAVSRIERAVTAAGMKVYARIDQAAEARSAGGALRPLVLLVFGNPKAGTPLMAAKPTVALDLPLKALVWEDDAGARWLTYNTPALLVVRHGLAQDLAAKLAPAGDLLEKSVRG